jgi:hypothetical protein
MPAVHSQRFYGPECLLRVALAPKHEADFHFF